MAGPSFAKIYGGWRKLCGRKLPLLQTFVNAFLRQSRTLLAGQASLAAKTQAKLHLHAIVTKTYALSDGLQMLCENSTSATKKHEIPDKKYFLSPHHSPAEHRVQKPYLSHEHIPHPKWVRRYGWER